MRAENNQIPEIIYNISDHMSKIIRHQENILKFLDTKSFINSTSDDTKKIINDILPSLDHLPSIMCLTLLNAQCKENNLKMHGYYVASGIDMIMIIVLISDNREYYEEIYGKNEIENLVNEIISWYYWSISQNIRTLVMNGCDNNKACKTFSKCIEMSIKYITEITKKTEYKSKSRMKKTDIYAYKFGDDHFEKYKMKRRLNNDTIKKNTDEKYGSICSLAMVMGWLLGLGDETKICRFENVGKNIGMMMKICNDFRNVARDIMHGKISLNYIVNNGIKEGYSELIEAKAVFIEESMKADIFTKTMNEIIEEIVNSVNKNVENVVVTMEYEYDTCSE
jgi:hypothetical protein